MPSLKSMSSNDDRFQFHRYGMETDKILTIFTSNSDSKSLEIFRFACNNKIYPYQNHQIKTFVYE